MEVLRKDTKMNATNSNFEDGNSTSASSHVPINFPHKYLITLPCHKQLTTAPCAVHTM